MRLCSVFLRWPIPSVISYCRAEFAFEYILLKMCVVLLPLHPTQCHSFLDIQHYHYTINALFIQIISVPSEKYTEQGTKSSSFPRVKSTKLCTMVWVKIEMHIEFYDLTPSSRWSCHIEWVQQNRTLFLYENQNTLQRNKPQVYPTIDDQWSHYPKSGNVV